MILAKTMVLGQEIVTIGYCCLFLDTAIPGWFSISPEKYKSFDQKHMTYQYNSITILIC